MEHFDFAFLLTHAWQHEEAEPCAWPLGLLSDLQQHLRRASCGAVFSMCVCGRPLLPSSPGLWVSSEPCFVLLQLRKETAFGQPPLSSPPPLLHPHPHPSAFSSSVGAAPKVLQDAGVLVGGSGDWGQLGLLWPQILVWFCSMWLMLVSMWEEETKSLGCLKQRCILAY